MRRRAVSGAPAAPRTLLDKIRLQFWWMTVLVALIGFVDLARIPPLGPVAVAVHLGATVGIVAWAWWLVSTRGRWPVGDLVGPLLVAAVAVSAGDHSWAFSRLYALVFLHATIGSSRRAIVNVAAYTVAYTGAGVVVEGAPPVAQVVSTVVGLTVVTWIMRTMAATLQRHSAAEERERLLTSISGELLGATDSATVVSVALRGAAALVDGCGEARVSIWQQEDDELVMTGLVGRELDVARLPLDALPDGMRQRYVAGKLITLDPDEMAALQLALGSPVDFLHGLSIPLRRHADVPAGLVFIATQVPVDADVVSVLQRFVDEVALANVLTDRTALLASIVDNSPDGIIVVDEHDRIRFASPAVRWFSGADPERLVGRPLGALLRSSEVGGPVGSLAEALERGGDLFAVATSEPHRQVELSCNAVDETRTVVNLRDVTERRQLERELSYRAFHDATTGLPNRALFADRLEHALRRSERDGMRVGVALIDLDDFKGVNDSLGHAAGDALLVHVAKRLQRVARRSDTAARLGGDEFAVLLEGLDDEREALEATTRILDELRRPVIMAGREVSAGASVGLAIASAGADEASLLRDADVAMYESKRTGRGRVTVYTAGMGAAAMKRVAMRTELEIALREGHLILHYQPIVDLRTQTPVAFEALVRWQHPERGTIPPSEFIMVAEASGMIVPIGRWVLEQACRELAALQARVPEARRLRVSVNLSAHHLLDDHLLDDVQATLLDTGVAPELLTLEVTETALMTDPERAGRLLTALRELGVRVAIDDFGAGYSSFSYLQRFPVDVLKVDRMFVDVVADGPEQAALAHAIVKLAGTLGIATVAEGVERDEQRDILLGWECTFGQGWLWAPAMPASELLGWLEGHTVAAHEAGLRAS